MVQDLDTVLCSVVSCNAEGTMAAINPEEGTDGVTRCYSVETNWTKKGKTKRQSFQIAALFQIYVYFIYFFKHV